jgi:hypothetical protein
MAHLVARILAAVAVLGLAVARGTAQRVDRA